jgi:polar amino acid transport system permease protein
MPVLPASHFFADCKPGRWHVYQWNFNVIEQNWQLLADGLLNTLTVTGVSLVFGVCLGLILALARLSRFKVLSWPATGIVDFFRITPPLVQLFWFFFALPILFNVEMTPFIAAILTFSIQSSAFFAEVFRAGIMSIERGQWEGARAIGMNYVQAMRRVILPQAVKRMIPAFLERSIELLKATAIVSTVSYADLLFQANDLSQRTFRPLEIFTTVAVIYFILVIVVSQIVEWLERRLAAAGNSTVRQ